MCLDTGADCCISHDGTEPAGNTAGTATLLHPLFCHQSRIFPAISIAAGQGGHPPRGRLRRRAASLLCNRRVLRPGRNREPLRCLSLAPLPLIMSHIAATSDPSQPLLAVNIPLTQPRHFNKLKSVVAVAARATRSSAANPATQPRHTSSKHHRHRRWRLGARSAQPIASMIASACPKNLPPSACRSTVRKLPLLLLALLLLLAILLALLLLRCLSSPVLIGRSIRSASTAWTMMAMGFQCVCPSLAARCHLLYAVGGVGGGVRGEGGGQWSMGRLRLRVNVPGGTQQGPGNGSRGGCFS